MISKDREKQAMDYDMALCERDHLKDKVDTLTQQRDALVEAYESAVKSIDDLLERRKSETNDTPYDDPYEAGYSDGAVDTAASAKAYLEVDFLFALSKAKGEGHE